MNEKWAYQDVRLSESAVLQGPVRAGQDAEQAPGHEKVEPGLGVIVGQEFRVGLQRDGRREHGHAHHDVRSSQ